MEAKADVTKTSDPPLLFNINLQSPQYSIDDKVYCHSDDDDDDDERKSNHHPHAHSYYKAIIRQARYVTNNNMKKEEQKESTNQRGSWEYLVHFVGWNNRFDVWKPERSLFRKKEDNKRSNNNNDEDNHSSSAFSRPWKKQQWRAGRSHGESNPDDDIDDDDDDETAKDATRRSLFFQEYCELPFTLKTVLIDEYNTIAKHNMVHVIPAPVPIRKVLQFFESKKIKAIQQQQLSSTKTTNENQPTPPEKTTTTTLLSETSSATLEDIREFTRGITELFRTALPICLLYPQERWQYEQQQQQMNNNDNNLAVEDVYGCEYLLRLYVRLPILLQPAIHRAATANLNMPFQNPKKLAIYGNLLAELLVLMQKNRQALFSSSVRPAVNANYNYHCDSSPSTTAPLPPSPSRTSSSMAMETTTTTASPSATMDTTQ
jgi:hypothetical protein